MPTPTKVLQVPSSIVSNVSTVIETLYKCVRVVTDAKNKEKQDETFAFRNMVSYLSLIIVGRACSWKVQIYVHILEN